MGRTKSPAKNSRGKKVKDPNKPKRSTSAYFYFLADKRVEFKRLGKNTSKIAEFTKECSELWRNLTSEAKKPYDKKAEVDKARYDREMCAYKGKSSKKEDGKPKKPQTAYFLFLGDFRIKMKNSDIDHKDIIRKAGEEWRSMTDGDKKPYEQRALIETKKYEKAVKEWQQGGASAGAAKQQVANNGMDEDEDDEEDDDEEEDDDDEEDEDDE